ncbi:MAG: response regulator [Treponema sp.]|nr:response regulator [Treponema sp.]
MIIHVEVLEQIFDSDYYFGYQICFLSNIITYGIYIVKKSLDSKRAFEQYCESTYFLKATAHELLSPVTLIENALEELESTSNGNEKQISIIEKNCERIKNMTVLANTLEIHEQNFDTLKLESCVVDLNSEFKKSLENFELYAKSKKIKIEASVMSKENLFVKVQPLYLETIFLNLIDNAMKHSSSATNIFIKLDFDEEKSLVTFTVKNPCGKLRTQNLEEIFEFGKHISEKNILGLGLGLHLTRRICRLYQGDCTARIEDNQVIFQAKFFLEQSEKQEENKNTLIEKKNHQQSTQSVLSPYNTELNFRKNKNLSRTFDEEEKIIKKLLSNTKILLVEDDLDLQKSIKDFLADYSTIFTSSNGEEALILLSKEKINLIISDMLMPVMSGEEFYAECKKSKNLSHIPFIILTGLRDNKLRKKILTQGASDYLCKPFNNEDLLLKIYSLLNMENESRKKLRSDLSDFLSNQSDFIPEVSSNKINAKKDDEKFNAFFKEHDFSKREIEIAKLMAESKTNAEIANALFISVSTVATHVQHIYNKCNAKNRADFISMLIKN